MPDSLLLGVDIGGTKVAAGLVTPAGEIIYKTRVPMKADDSAEMGLAAVAAAIATTRNDNPSAQISGIGVISPGPLDPRTGVILNPPNLPCWRNFGLASALEAACGFPVRVDNDANAAALAEALWGAGIGFRALFYATLGTGVGTGVVFDRHLYYGRTGAGPEGGHMTIDHRAPSNCGCGKPGCVEGLISGNAIGARARAKIKSDPGRAARLLQLAGGDPAKVTGEIVGQAWRHGDPLATEVLRETAGLMTVWLGNIVDLLEPDAIVIGGGVGELMSQWFDYIREHLPRWSIIQRCHETPLLLARYKADAGIAGAAALCLS